MLVEAPGATGALNALAVAIRAAAKANFMIKILSASQGNNRGEVFVG